MSGYNPLEPCGNNAEALFDRAVWQKTYGPESRIRSTSTVNVQYRTDGIFLNVRPSVLAAQTGAQEFNYAQGFGDYFLSTTGVAIAKLPELRNSITVSNVYGTNISFTYPHNPVGGGPAKDLYSYVYRIANLGSIGTEVQGVIPCYQVGSIIVAIPCNTSVMTDPKDTASSKNGIPVAVNWVQISPAYWCAFADQTTGL